MAFRRNLKKRYLGFKRHFSKSGRSHGSYSAYVKGGVKGARRYGKRSKAIRGGMLSLPVLAGAVALWYFVIRKK